jgi:hypothetical protein
MSFVVLDIDGNLFSQRLITCSRARMLHSRVPAEILALPTAYPYSVSNRQTE